jgi:hypothetical protein
MTASIPQPDFQQDCLDKLGCALDLVLKTAEAAGAENNHKIVIQAAREVTRIATLITKMTNPKIKSARSMSPEPKAPADCQNSRPSSRCRPAAPQPRKMTSNRRTSSSRTSTPSFRPTKSLPGTR